MEKSIHEQKGELVYLCIREKKSNSFEITNHFKICTFLQFKKDFKIAELLPKHHFFFTLETVLKLGKEANKGDAESICARVTKPASKKVANAEVDLN